MLPLLFFVGGITSMKDICITRRLKVPNRISKPHAYTSLEEMLYVIQDILRIKESLPKSFFQIDEIEINDSMYVDTYPVKVMSRVVNKDNNPELLPISIEDMNNDNFEIISRIICEMMDTRDTKCYSHMMTYTPQIITIHEGINVKTKLIIDCKFGGND